MDRSGVYAIKCRSSGRVYVGSAVNIRKRWNGHRGALRNHCHANKPLTRAVEKYGIEALEFVVLEYVQDATRLIEREQYWIDRLDAVRNGYNMAPRAGSTLGRPCNAETRAKIGAANRGRKFEGEKLARKQAAARHPDQIARLRALVRTPEQRATISRAKGGTGKVLTHSDALLAVELYETGDHTVKGLAARFGVSYAIMFKALRGDGCKGARGRPARSGREAHQIRRRISLTLASVSPETMKQIAARKRAGEYQNALAKEFGVSTATISRIINKYSRGLRASQ